MIEIYDDGEKSSVMMYTDEAQTAKELRKAFEAAGALYLGKERGFSWRVSRYQASSALKRLGRIAHRIFSVEK